MPKMLLHELHGGAAARVILNAPPGNILDGEMMAELTWAARELAGKTRLRAVILEGEGAHFSYGSSVQEHQRENAAPLLTSFHEMLLAFLDVGAPLVAKVRGQCLGGGLELAALCHFVLCDRTARFGTPETKLGVFAPAASILLPQRLGQGRADQMLLAGRELDAEEAVAWGLATAVADWDALDVMCDRFVADRLLVQSASSLRHAARAAHLGMDAALRAQLPVLEKRAPRWRHE